MLFEITSHLLLLSTHNPTQAAVTLKVPISTGCAHADTAMLSLKYDHAVKKNGFRDHFSASATPGTWAHLLVPGG